MALSRAARLLRDFVAIPSVNPMGRSDIDPAITGERRYAEARSRAAEAARRRCAVIGQGERASVVGAARRPRRDRHAC